MWWWCLLFVILILKLFMTGRTPPKMSMVMMRISVITTTTAVAVKDWEETRDDQKCYRHRDENTVNYIRKIVPLILIFHHPPSPHIIILIRWRVVVLSFWSVRWLRVTRVSHQMWEERFILSLILEKYHLAVSELWKWFWDLRRQEVLFFSQKNRGMLLMTMTSGSLLISDGRRWGGCECLLLMLLICHVMFEMLIRQFIRQIDIKKYKKMCGEGMNCGLLWDMGSQTSSSKSLLVSDMTCMMLPPIHL